MSKLLAAIVAVMFAFGTTAVVAADTNQDVTKKDVTKKDAGKKGAMTPKTKDATKKDGAKKDAGKN